MVIGLDDESFTEIVSGELKPGDLAITAEQIATAKKAVTPRALIRASNIRKRNMPEPIIRVANVTRTYHVGDIDVHALRGVNLIVEPGEFIAIMGSSGSGKSTFMSLLGCLDRPSSGEYYLEGVNVAAADRARACTHPQRTVGLCLSELQSSRPYQCDRECRATFVLRRREVPSSGTERTERARASLKLLGLSRPGAQYTGTIVRRSAATRRHRTRLDQQSDIVAGG